MAGTRRMDPCRIRIPREGAMKVDAVICIRRDAAAYGRRLDTPRIGELDSRVRRSKCRSLTALFSFQTPRGWTPR